VAVQPFASDTNRLDCVLTLRQVEVVLLRGLFGQVLQFLAVLGSPSLI
jgi:hypothetical protein